MPHQQREISIETAGQGLYEFTAEVSRFAAASGIAVGLLTCFCRHTSASLTIQENADPDVQHDLLGFLSRLVPENQPWFRHTTEGPDDMPAHIKAMLSDVSVTIPVTNAKPALGTWQGVYLVEHRIRPHHRRVILHLSGD